MTVRYYTLEGNGLLRVTRDDDEHIVLTESMVRNQGFVENADAIKYFIGVGGDQKDAWEILPDAALEQAASLGVTLALP